MKALADKMAHRKEESELSSGMLYATGLVAGGSLGGVAIALVTASGDLPFLKRGLESKGGLMNFLDLGDRFYPALKNGPGGQILCAAVFGVLCFLLVRNARKDLEA